jgi:hypothetical protein
MDPRDHLRALLDGMACTVCDAPVPAERIHLVANREDLTFLQIACQAFGSTALGSAPESTGDLRDHGAAGPA